MFQLDGEFLGTKKVIMMGEPTRRGLEEIALADDEESFAEVDRPLTVNRKYTHLISEGSDAGRWVVFVKVDRGK